MTQSSAQITSNVPENTDFSQFCYVHGTPKIKGQLKSTPEDFVVEEQVGYSLTGEGEHLWCWVEKRCENTDWVAGMLAKWANTSKRNVGFAGQKDRNAVTRQWFSIQLPGKEDPDIDTFDIEGVKILKVQRHNRKLHRGGLSGNRFELTLRNLSTVNEDSEVTNHQIQKTLDLRLQAIMKEGVPNYFGEQRFGKKGNNLLQGEKLLCMDSRDQKSRRAKQRRGSKGGNRNQQSLYISSLRSWMFNVLLSKRVQACNWNRAVEGDALQLSGSSKWFLADESEDFAVLQQRVLEGDLNPTGGLFGDGELPTQSQSKLLEQQVMSAYSLWCDGLANNRVQQDRRALRLMPEDMKWSFNSSVVDGNECLSLNVSFTLTSGSFATMVLREILQTYEERIVY